jgi:environmental stress-induced protein Ves
MSFKILIQDNYIQKPWKNGLGITCEIATHPINAESDFDWRVSMADINQSGPFSHFPGIDRVLVLLDGPSLTLRRPTLKTDCEIALYQPYHFSGDIETVALVQGLGKDFNVMTKRGKVSADVTIKKLSTGQMLEMAESFNHLIVFCCEGHLICHDLEVGARDSLLLEKDFEPILASENSLLLICRFNLLK